ncbi:helix-turn-helix transcriptional regulator [Actinotalea sp. K2]|uniref:LuxR C-terminal-related transcriptional regulator n=1 Tax=Actinotalea sp. K2 TaxID=2939438 RepID=UPI0020174A7F|nr:helix-turn-helix transcriptional regulator [Actinotalea sp. K2]MCL3861849.1 LuxR C-terminal-related transcriptional regulator [Actinotalea sp. K2]
MSQIIERQGTTVRALEIPVALVDGRWPISPRRRESAAIRSALAAGRSVVVVGEAGVGKTCLVDQTLADVPAAAGRRLITLSASALGTDTTVPGGPSRIPDLAQGGRSGARPTTVPAPRTPPDTRTVVRVEDAHLLDPSTAQELARLARQGEIQLLATFRVSGASASPWLELWKDAVADRVDVVPLSRPEVRDLLQEALGGTMTTETSQRIWDQTLGNPFYVRELVRSELEAGVLQHRNGVWVGLSGAAPGARVVDVVRSDLARLSPAVREALDLVALSEPVPVNRVVHLIQDGALDRLVQDGLVTVGHRSRVEEGLVPTVRVTPPMYGDAVRVLVPLERRRRLLAAVRSSAATSPVLQRETPTSLLRSVVWALECGVREPPARLRQAMESALGLYQPAVAVQIGHAALEHNPESGVFRARVLLLRAQAWRLMGDSSRALRDLAEVPQQLAGPSTGEHRMLAIRLAEQHADLAHHHGDDVDGSLATIAELRRELDADAHEHGPALDAARLLRLGRAGRFAETLEPSLSILEATPFPRIEALRLGNPTVLALGQHGRFVEADLLAQRLTRVAVAQADHVPWMSAEIEVAQFVVLVWAGELRRAEELMDTQHDSGFTVFHAFGDLGRGLLAAGHGQWSDARRELHAANARFALLDPHGMGAYGAAIESLAAAAVGDVSGAHRLMELAQRTPLRVSGSVESDVRLHLLDAAAWLRLPTVGRDALRLAGWSAEHDLRRPELEALHRLLVAERQQGPVTSSGHAVLARMRELALVGRRPEALVAHASALVDGDDQLAQMASRELARCGVWLPTGGDGPGLTRREREIAGLAAGGLSSRAIAERLTVSVRTVDSHLARVFAKLGVRSRQDLGAALHS